MKTINKFDTFDELDDFDKMLFDYYKNQDVNIPLSTQNAIKNAFNDKHKKNPTAFAMLKKVAVFILALGIITTTTVYAKDIVNFIANIFTNSNRGIDIAVDNGYVQNVDMDYVICNDVGVKVDYLLMDDKSLDISFVYKYFGEMENVQNINASELIIKDEKGNIICLISQSSSTDTIIENTASLYGTTQYTDELFRNSLLISSHSLPTSKTLYIEMSEITFIIDKELKYLTGNWIFTIDIEDKFVVRVNENYIASSESPYLDSVITNLSDTSLSIELNLNILFDETTLYTGNSIVLKDKNGNIYRPSKMFSYNTSSGSIITLLYPITKYDNINELYLSVNLDIKKQIIIKLSK